MYYGISNRFSANRHLSREGNKIVAFLYDKLLDRHKNFILYSKDHAATFQIIGALSSLLKKNAVYIRYKGSWEESLMRLSMPELRLEPRHPMNQTEYQSFCISQKTEILKNMMGAVLLIDMTGSVDHNPECLLEKIAFPGPVFVIVDWSCADAISLPNLHQTDALTAKLDMLDEEALDILKLCSFADGEINDQLLKAILSPKLLPAFTGLLKQDLVQATESYVLSPALYPYLLSNSPCCLIEEIVEKLDILPCAEYPKISVILRNALEEAPDNTMLEVSLGKVLQHLGYYFEAGLYFRKALAIMDRTESCWSETVVNIALTAVNTLGFPSFEPDIEALLCELRDQNDSAEIAFVWAKYASMSGRTKDARSYCQQLLDAETDLSEQSKLAAGMAYFYAHLDDWTATRFATEAYPYFKNTGTQTEEILLEVLSYGMGSLDERISYAQRLLEYRRHYYWPNHIGIVHAYQLAAELYDKMNDYCGAVEHMEAALSIAKKIYPPNHIHTDFLQNQLFQLNQKNDLPNMNAAELDVLIHGTRKLRA